MQIILQPCSNANAKEHYFHTIENPVSLQKIKLYLDANDFQQLSKIYRDGSVMIWGTKNINRSKWEKIQYGDVVLFSRDKQIFASVVVTYKLYHHELAKYLWGTDQDDDSWDCIYFLDELQNITLSYHDFNLAVGYKTNYVIQGFSIVNSEKANHFFDLYPIKSLRYVDDVSFQEYEKIIYDDQINRLKRLKECDTLEDSYKTQRRKEQSFLRKYLFGNQLVANCSICGRLFPVELLWCSHIKTRSDCSKEEKLDYQNIVTPMCKFGCDDLYEKGFIGVQDGIVKVLKYSKIDSVDEYLKMLENKPCLNYNEANKKYYDAHLLKYKNSVDK